MTDKERAVIEAARKSLIRALERARVPFSESVAHEIEELINAKLIEHVQSLAALDASEAEPHFDIAETREEYEQRVKKYAAPEDVCGTCGDSRRITVHDFDGYSATTSGCPDCTGRQDHGQ